MDQCIGSVMPLHAFVSNVPVSMHYSLSYLLYASELLSETWLIRPAVMIILPLVWNAYRSKAIQGAFIYSNNSSTPLVSFMATFLNTCIQRIMRLSTMPNVFAMAVSQESPCRSTTGRLKTYDGIQIALQQHHLPECSSRNDLLFFDDMHHRLELEIAHYILVPPYYRHTDISLLLEAFSPMRPVLGEDLWYTIEDQGSHIQQSEMREHIPELHIAHSQDPECIASEMELFRGAIRAFLAVE